MTMRDVFRREYFGGFYFSRRTRGTTAFPAEYAEFLVETMHRPAPQVLDENRGRFPTIESCRTETLDEWRRDGILDDVFQCRARLVENHAALGVLTAPIATSFELTERCNLRCGHCYVGHGTLRDDEVTPDVLDRAFRDLADAGSPGITLSGGEPLMRDDVWQILDRASAHGLDVKFCTNATLVHQEEARRLAGYPIHTFSISLDGGDPETHDRVRGVGNFARVTRGVRALKEAGARKVMLRVTVTALNIGTLSNVAAIADAWQVDTVSFRPYRFNGAALDEELLVSRADYGRAMRSLEARWQGKCVGIFGSPLPTRSPRFAGYIPRFGCNGGHGTLAVKADGSVVACATIRELDEWNLKDHGLLECWHQAPALLRWRAIEAPAECSTCPRLDACGGGCRARALAMKAGSCGPDPWCCDRQQASEGR